MKSKKLWLGILVMALVFGMMVIGCDAQVQGTTWVESDGKDDCILEFGSPPNMTFKDGWRAMAGTYTVSGNKVTMTLDDEIMTGTKSGNTLLLNYHGETFTFTKK